MARTQSQNFSGLPTGLLIGAGGSMAVTLLLCALIAYLTNREMISEESARSSVVLVLILSSAAGSLLACRKVGHHRILVCAGAGLSYYLTLIGCTALFFEGEFRNIGITAVAILGGALLITLLGLREGSKGYSRHNIKHHNWKLVQNRQRGN